MAKTKTPNSKLFDDEDFVMPENIMDLYELAHKLWMAYWLPDEPLTPAQKKELMQRYNEVAAAINKQKPGTILELTPKTKWVPTKMYAGDKGIEDKSVVHLPRENNTTAPATESAPVKSTTKPAPAKKTATPKTEQEPATETPPAGGSNITAQIVALHKQGLSNAEIVAKGFNKSTVARQVGEYKKRVANGKE